MLIAIIILLSFLSKTSKNIASILGGIGFGTFIDELGKFITNDNNYFFRPTIALIYIIFVLIYLLLKFIPNFRQTTEKEYLVNTLETLKEAAINDFDEDEERKAYEYLHKCDPQNPIVQSLTTLLSKMTAAPTPPPSTFTKIQAIIKNWYYLIAKSDLIIKIIIFYLAFQTVDTIINSSILALTKQRLPFDEWGKLYASGLAAIFVIIGLLSLKFSKLEAYRFFRIAVLISILLTQFFSFMRGGWIELIPLLANIFILMVINYAMAMEQQKKVKVQHH